MPSNDNHTFIIPIILIILLLGSLIFCHVSLNHVRGDLATATRQCNSAQEKDEAHRHKVDDEADNDALHSNNPKAKAIAQNSLDSLILNLDAKKFFMIYYNWSNHNDYVTRPVKLHSLALSNVYKDKKFFNNDKDSSGDSVVNAEGLQSSFESVNAYIASVHNHQATVLIDAIYNAKSTGNNQATGEAWFQMGFNLSNGKFTSMKELNHNPNINKSSD